MSDSDDPITLNGYTYAINNPVMLVDPDGNWVMDVFWLMLDAAEFMGHPSLAGAGWIAADLAAFADPSGIASTVAHAGKMTRVGKKLSKAVKLSKRAKRAKKARHSCNCFTAGTKVLTDKGEKPIEDIKVGDKVLSKNEETGEVAYKEVKATFNHETGEIYKIHVGDQTIESTFNHPFWVDGKGWMFVKDLKPGDLLVQGDGNKLKIGSIELEDKHVTAYNMTVDEFHTYFVSDLGIWVHNTGACNWTPMTGNTLKNAAKKHGFEPTNYRTKNGQKVFYNKKTKTYISQDIGSGNGMGPHNGGVWKHNT